MSFRSKQNVKHEIQPIGAPCKDSSPVFQHEDSIVYMYRSSDGNWAIGNAADLFHCHSQGRYAYAKNKSERPTSSVWVWNRPTKGHYVDHLNVYEPPRYTGDWNTVQLTVNDNDDEIEVEQFVTHLNSKGKEGAELDLDTNLQRIHGTYTQMETRDIERARNVGEELAKDDKSGCSLM